MSSHREAERLTGALELALVWALATAPAAWAGDAPDVCFQTARKIESGVHFQELLLVDADGDGKVDISDPIWLLNGLFREGPKPACDDAADSNDSGAVDISDAVFGIAYQLMGGPSPPAPFPECGEDPSLDPIDCSAYSKCATGG